MGHTDVPIDAWEDLRDYSLLKNDRDNIVGTDRPGHHHTAEQISYVLHGHAEMRVGDRIRAVEPGSLLMIPSDVDHLPMTPINNEEILLLDFQPIIRSIILAPFGKGK